jgi:dethiobiotin synthetase
MLNPPRIPGLFITGTDTAVGKTVITAAIATALRQQGRRVGVVKPVASGCVQRREGLVSEDAELLAHHADSPHPLDIIAPQRFAEPLAPAVAAQRLGEPIDWSAVQRSVDTISAASNVLLIEGVGGILVPLDRDHTVLDLARSLNLPVVIVARASLGTINHTLLTAAALRQANVRIAGVIINEYPAENAGLAEETNPRAIERYGKLPVLAIVPKTTAPIGLTLPQDIVAPIAAVDWFALANPARDR